MIIRRSAGESTRLRRSGYGAAGDFCMRAIRFFDSPKRELASPGIRNLTQRSLLSAGPYVPGRLLRIDLEDLARNTVNTGLTEVFPQLKIASQN